MFVSDFSKPLILQSDFSLLLDVHNPLFDEARARLSAFAELEKSPEHIHTYRMTPLSLWNAASAGLPAESILETLSRYSRFPVPPAVRAYIESTVSKFGKIVLTDGGEGKIEIRIDDGRVRREILSQKPVARLITEEDGKLFVSLLNRGFLKQALIDIGYPAQDKAPLVDGEPLKLSLRTPTAASGKPFRIRDYQADAVKAFYRPQTPGTGYGVVVLPCGSGKTVVGIGVLNELQCAALILTANISAVRQWKEDKGNQGNHCCHLPDSDVAQRRRRRVSPLFGFYEAQLGTDYLRRSASAAGAGFPDYRRNPGHAAAWVDGDADSRRRTGKRRLFSCRSETL